MYRSLYLILLCYLFRLLPVQAQSWEPVRISYLKENSSISNTCYTLYKDSRGYIWMGTAKGLIRYDGKHFKAYTTREGLPDNEVFSIKEDEQGRIWLCTYSSDITYIQNGIVHNNENTEWLKEINKKMQKAGYIHPAVQNKDSSILFFQTRDKVLTEIKGGKVSYIPVPPYAYSYAEKDFGYIKYADGTYGMVTSKGFLHFDRSGRIREWHCLKIDLFFSLPEAGKYIYLHRDKLFNEAFDTLAFKNARRLKGSYYMIPGYIDGTLKIATKTGIHDADGTTTYKNRDPTAILKGNINDYWIGTLKEGLYNEFRDIYFRKQSFIPTASGIYAYNDEMLHRPVSLSMGTYYYTFHRYKLEWHQEGSGRYLFNQDSVNKIINITCDYTSNKLLVCGFNYAYEIKGNYSRKIETPYTYHRLISFGDGYIAMDKKMLFYLDRNYTIKDSLKRPNIINLVNVNDSLYLLIYPDYMELIKDKNGKYTRSGTFKSDFIKANILQAELKKDSLLVYTAQTAYKYIINGTNTAQPRLLADLFAINGTFYTTYSMTLDYGKDYLVNLNLSLIDHMYGDARYEYSLHTKSDPDTQWSISTNEQISLLLQNPGNYVLKVRARTANDVLSNTLTYYFTIPVPLWRHTAFIIGLSVVLTGLMFFIIYTLQRRKRAKVLKEKDLELRFFQSELRSMNALMNPHFTFNALNSIQFMINDNQNEGAQRYLSTFANLLRRNMHNLENNFISLKEELELIRSYLLLEQMRSRQNFSFDIRIEDDIDPSGIMIPPLLIQPVVENAVLHGINAYRDKEGLIRISINRVATGYHISIMDNGNATPHISINNSFGLKNITGRLRQINDRYEKNYQLLVTERFISEEVKWTKVTLQLDN